VNQRNPRPEPPDLSKFHENRCSFPPEQLASYYGKFVAWSPDGTRILATGDSDEEVDQKLEEMGIHFSQVVHGYVDPPDLVFLG
jgi:hypothetical protein